MRKIYITILLFLTAVTLYLLPLDICYADQGTSKNTDEILIGYFGPSDPCHLEGGEMWLAATMAVEQANEKGGYKGRPFRLVPGWSENPWGSGVKDVARMAYQYNVCAIVGGIDGPSTHLAEQVVAKAQLPLLSGANADRTANLANVTWMFSALPGHHLQARALAGAIESFIGKEEFIVVSSVDHDSHLLSVELGKSFRKRQLLPSYHFDFKNLQENGSELVDRVIRANPKAIVIVAPLKDSTDLCIKLRNKGFEGIIFGSPCMSQHRFIENAGDACEGVVFPVLYEPTQKLADFEKKFFRRFARHSNYLSAHTYDTVNILMEAIRKVGPERQRIRDEIEKLSPWDGVTGQIVWDKQGSNSRRVSIGTVSTGCVKILKWDNDIIYSLTSSTDPQ